MKRKAQNMLDWVIDSAKLRQNDILDKRDTRKFGNIVFHFIGKWCFQLQLSLPAGIEIFVSSQAFIYVEASRKQINRILAIYR